MRASTKADYEARVARAERYIEAHLDDELRLDDLAQVACLSSFHFHRIFRGMTGETVAACVRRLRLQRAATRLRQLRASVTDIAFDAGYDSLEGFSRAFRERFGCAPSEWRETAPHRPSPEKKMDVRVVPLGALHLVSLRHTGPYSAIGPVFGRLAQWAGAHGLFRGPVEFIGLPYDDPDATPSERIRCDAALLVPTAMADDGDVRATTLDARDYAVVRHVGAYETLSDTYAWLCGVWLPASGREAAAAPPLEFYRNHPGNTAPDALVTDIHLPLDGASPGHARVK